MLIHQGHDATSLVERRIGKILFLFQGPQPLLHFQRFDAKCDSVPPSWQQAVSENSLVAFYGCLRHCRLSLVKRMLYGLSNILKRETREGRQESKTADQGGSALDLSDGIEEFVVN